MTPLDVETPAAVVDLERLERNLARWQARCDELGLANRPHIKTHKCVEIARRQIELGAAGLTCQTLGEAEVMSEAGIENLLVATNVLGDRKLARLSGLLEAATMTVVADDAGLLPGLGRAAARAGRELRVLVECDTGLQRTGVASPDEAVELAASVSAIESLEFAGFLTYPAPPGALEFLARAAELALERGLNVATVSAGGTPSMWSAAGLQPTVTEYRVGTYAFHDRATVAAGAAQPDEVALTVCATVVSRPARDRAILDAGSKALSSDLSTEPGYGLVLEAPSSLLVRLNEEHGYVELAPGDELELGQQVHVVPNHACVVANLFERLAVVSDGVVSATWTVERRR